MAILTIKNLHASVGNTKILNGVSLNVSSKEIHIIMGQNGSGKSTLLSVLMGSPKYTVTKGSAALDGKNILKLSPAQRAQAGLFLAFQHPQAVAGVSLGNFLRLARNTVKKTTPIAPAAFAGLMRTEMDKLNIDQSFMMRSVNDGLSGGEKKKSEILQMAILQPKIAFLDEIDSGLDIDALKIVSRQINAIHKAQGMGLVIVSHNLHILDFIKPDKIHIMSKGKIVASGGQKIIKKVEQRGFEGFSKKK
ncbi:MAG: Fe-S cluster assembly ATPase SufC [Patescibacteria group bacterium]